MRVEMRLLIAMVVLLVAAAAVRADDWPQFRGPNRDGRSAETGLLKQWPEGGPKLLWTAAGLGKGYSHVVVVGGRIYTTGLVGKEGMLRCLDGNGSLVWEKSYGPEWTGDKTGSRSIPTVHEGLAYVASGMGWVSCFDANTGDKKWSQDMFKRYEAPQVKWGWAASILIDGNNAIFTPCGKKGTMVAVDRFTGEHVWASKALGETSGFCSPLLIETHSGWRPVPSTATFVTTGLPLSIHSPPINRLIVTLTDSSVIGVDPAGGEVIWRHPYRNSNGNHPVTPLYHNGMLYVTSGYGKGAVGLEIDPNGRSVKQLWEEKKQDTCHGGVVLVAAREGAFVEDNWPGYVYGSSDRNSSGWVCADFATGKVAWQDKCVGKGGSVIYADGMLYCYAEDGTVGLVKASGKACEVVSRFKVTQGAGEHWAHPAISNGRLYIRHGDALMCYGIRE